MNMNKILLTIGLTLIITSWGQAMNNKPVDMLVAPYLKIQKGLAGDDLASAQTGAMELLVMLKHAHFEAEAGNLSDSAKSIAGAPNIATARNIFLDLSLQIQVLIKRYGTSGETPLYVANCPMAFGGKGGTWIQSEKAIENPYYGSQMFACGSIQEQIGGSE